MRNLVGASDQSQRIIFFGDQTVDVLPCIKTLNKRSYRLPGLRRFLRDAADVIQCLLADLDLDGYDDYRQFETIAELADIYSKQDATHEPIGCALWTTSQFADLVMHAETDPSLLESIELAAQLTYVVGVCTGLLPAAAMATARNMKQLLDIGRKLVAVAFRLGVAQWRRALDIEGQPGRWAVAIVNVPPKQIQNIIDAFNEDMEIPKHRHFYISFLAKGWAAVSGPPSLFPELWEYSSTLQSASKMDLPLGTPAHAAHLPPLDIAELIGIGGVLNLPVRSDYMVISTSTCQPFECKTFGSLLAQSLHDIAGETLKMDGVNDHVISCLDRRRVVQVSSFGPASQIGAFKKALEEAGLQVDVDWSGSDAVGQETEESTESTETEREGSNLIAIVGQSVRFPGSDDVETFWDNLKEGRSFESEMPPHRFDLAHHYDPTGTKAGSVTAKYGNFLDRPGLFDSRLFNMSPREAKQMDPIQRILLMCSYEALQGAGYSPDGSLSTNRMRVATYFGQSGDIPATNKCFHPGKLNYHYKWGGGHYSIDSDCTASTTTVMMARNALLARECDMALAGGGQLIMNAVPGHCRGEGVGVVVLKRLEDALADKDNILAVVRGADRNFSWDATSKAQVKLIQKVLRDAGVEPDEVGFVEMDGTGTTASGVVEMETVTTIFGSRPNDNPLYVGDVKASIGHAGAAAGVASLIKAVEVMRHKTIPRQPGFPGPRNPAFAFNQIDPMNIRIPDAALSFAVPIRPFSQDGKVKVLINNFDASGSNNCVLLEEAPVKKCPAAPQDPRGYYAVGVSARTAKSLKMNIEKLAAYLQRHPDASVSDVAYTTTARRMHEDLRKSYTIQSTAELMTLLEGDARKDLSTVVPPATKSVVFAFTGQEAAYPGMGKELFDTFQPFRETVESLHKLAVWQGFPEFVHLIADNQTDLGSCDLIQIQLAVVVLGMAIAATWKSWGIVPDLVVGYSLGEYAALHVAGVLSAHDVLFLVGHRAQLMQERCTPGSNVPYSFHCAQVDPILDDFSDLADRIPFAKPRIPVASSLDGTIVTDEGVFDSSYLARQTRQPVDFVRALKACGTGGLVDKTSLWLEVGPKRVLNSLVEATLSVDQRRLVHAVDDKDNNWKTMTSSAATLWREGVSVHWPKFHRHFRGSLRLVDLPTYAFDLEDYWAQPAASVQVASIIAAPVASALPSVPGFPTSTLQQVRSEQVREDAVTVTFESVLSHHTLLAMMEGHQVNGVAVFPASGFMDMAYTAAKYVHHRLSKASEPIPVLAIAYLSITHPLLPSGGPIQRMVVIEAVRKADNPVVEVTFKSREGSSTEIVHGGCTVRFEKKATWVAEWSQTAHFIEAAKNNVVADGTTGTGHRVLKQVAYKLFSSLVSYSEAYQGMQEVYCPADFQREAVAKVVLPAGLGLGEFGVNPHWLEALFHVCGFLLNGNPSLPYQDCFFFSSLDELRVLADDVKPGVPYWSYVYLHDGDTKARGDIYIFQDDRIVGIAKGVVFQRTTRRVLTTVLGGTLHHVPASSAPGSHQALGAAQNAARPAVVPVCRAIVGEEKANAAISMILCKMGATQAQLAPSTTLVDLGLDSLEWIELVGEFRSALDLEVPGSYFYRHQNVTALRRALAELPIKGQSRKTLGGTETAQDSLLPTYKCEEGQRTPVGSETDYESEGVMVDYPAQTATPLANIYAPLRIEEDLQSYHCDFFLLQGRSDSTETPLFFLPDGTGYPTVLLKLPLLFEGKNPLFTCKSPLLYRAEGREVTCTIEGLSDAYAAAIRRARTHGPYLLAGYSLGAAYAYEVAKILADAGEVVQGLLVVDFNLAASVNTEARNRNPVPPDLDVGIMDNNALMNGIHNEDKNFHKPPAPSKIKFHSLSVFKSLTRYDPIPMTPAQRPRNTYVIWAGASMETLLGQEVCGNLPAYSIIEWQIGKRKENNTAAGWDTYTGGEVKCVTVPCDHLSLMMSADFIGTTAKIMKDMLKDAMLDA